MTDIVERLRDDRYGAVPSQRAEAADEIERLRALLREVISSAWEMEFESSHVIDSEIIGRVAVYLLDAAFPSTTRGPIENIEDGA